MMELVERGWKEKLSSVETLRWSVCYTVTHTYFYTLFEATYLQMVGLGFRLALWRTGLRRGGPRGLGRGLCRSSCVGGKEGASGV